MTTRTTTKGAEIANLRILVSKGGAILFRPIFSNIAIFKQSEGARAGARKRLVSSTTWNFDTGARFSLAIRKKDK